MAGSKQADRRKLAKLRAEFQATPWALDVRVLGMLDHGLKQNDLEFISATLALGRRDAGEKPYEQLGSVAVIPVTGVLQDADSYMVRYGYASSYQVIERSLQQALDDEQIKSILFYFDTPGGSAIGCKRVADELFEHRGAKPMTGFVQTMCASAGYYIGAACDRIEATADSLVGSIGTIFPHQEFSGMLKEFGVAATVITNSESPKKAHGNIYEPLSDAAKQTLEQFVESYGAPFLSDVARYRGRDRGDVVSQFGQGDSMRADRAIQVGMVDQIVANFDETLASLSGADSTAGGVSKDTRAANIHSGGNLMNERIKAQLFALGLIGSLDAPDAECKAALNAWFVGRGQDVPADESDRLKSLQTQVKAEKAQDEDPDDDDPKDEEDDEETKDKGGKNKADRGKLKAAHEAEQYEARLENLQAAAELLNSTVGSDVISASMVLDAVKQKHTVPQATKDWQKKIAESEAPIPAPRLKGEGSERWAGDVVDALLYRAVNGEGVELSDNAAAHVRKPLSVLAFESLKMSGRDDVDPWGDRESIAQAAMAMGAPGQRHTFYSAKEGRQYVQASGSTHTRVGDFPNIFSGLANRFLDTVQLDDDYSYPQISAVLPGGLNDFKPAMMINKGVVEELDELQTDDEKFKQLGMDEEVLSYIFLRRFGNKFGWNPVMVANDDLGAFVEGMIGLQEAWQVTQNRLIVDLFTSNPTLLDGNALFADRADTGAGANPAANDNDRGSGNPPSDTEWGAMESLYADIGGINTGRRVRGTLTHAFVPTGSVAQEARRTFMPLNAGGLEPKSANTTTNVGIYRGLIGIIPESELRVASSAVWYGLRNPTRLNTATIVRAYFNGFGTGGRRERWYDPENKTTWISIEGRIATAVKNWRYAIRNAGSGA